MMGKNSAVRMRSAARVGEMQLNRRMGGVMGMRSVVWVRSTA